MVALTSGPPARVPVRNCVEHSAATAAVREAKRLVSHQTMAPNEALYSCVLLASKRPMPVPRERQPAAMPLVPRRGRRPWPACRSALALPRSCFLLRAQVSGLA